MPLLPSPAPSPTPSPAILEFLAKLSPPPPAPNSPPAPAFLCPACEKPNSSSARRRRQLSATAVPASDPLSRHSHTHHRSKTSDNYYSSLIAAVPPKFEQSSDGFWHLATSWSFHGKTSQPNLLSTPTSTRPPTLPSIIPSNVVSPTQIADLDDDGDNDDDNVTSTIPYDGSIESSINDVTSDYDAIKDSLPTGWTLPPERTKFYSVSVIVVVSLILAILVSLVIAGCVLGHKARSGSHSEGRQSLKKILNEARARANAQKNISRTTSRSTVDTEGGDPELEILSDSEKAGKILKQVKRKEKLWDKWRNKNGKLSDLGLRRRKKKVMTVNPTITTTSTVSTMNLVRASTPDIPESDPPAIPVFSPASNGRAESAANLVQSLPIPVNLLPKASSSSLPVAVGSLPQPLLPTSPLIPSSTPQWHPPAYPHGAIVNASSSHIQTYVDQADVGKLDVTLKGSLSLGRIQQFDHGTQTQLILDDDDDDCSRPEYPPPLLHHPFDLPRHAHVATDDKAVLERMRKGVSEPQDIDASTSTVTPMPLSLNLTDSNYRPNAPVWIDESLEDFQDHVGVPEIRNNDVKSPSSSKGQLHLPPLPSTDLHRHLERHYNIDIHFQSGDWPGQSSPSPLPSLSYQSQPSTSNLDLSSSSSYLQPSAPALEDTEEYDSSIQPRPSAPPLLSDEDEDDLANSSDMGIDDDGDERRSRWDREADLEASVTRTQSTPSINAVSTRSSGPSYSRSRRRRSLSASSITTFSGPPSASKRLSLPRYEP